MTTVILLTALAARLVSGPFGANMIAVRDNETAARVIGVPVLRTKLLAFALSSAIIAIAGVLWAFTTCARSSPAGFNPDRSFQILFIVIIGGRPRSAAPSSARPSSSSCRCCCRTSPQRLSAVRSTPARSSWSSGSCLGSHYPVPHRRARGAFRRRSSASSPASCRSWQGARQIFFTETPASYLSRLGSAAVALTPRLAGSSRRAVLPAAELPGRPLCRRRHRLLRRVHRLHEPDQSRDGGVNGVKLTWSEGETQYEVEKGSRSRSG